MSFNRTSIPYATHAANWQAGCSRVSPGCEHCWAERMSCRLAANLRAPGRYRGFAAFGPTSGPTSVGQHNLGPPSIVRDGRWTGSIGWDRDVFINIWGLGGHVDRLRKPSTIFLGDMSDLLHENAPKAALAALAGALRSVPDRHRYLICTKRPARLLDWQRREFPRGLPASVVVLASVCCQADADRMVPPLLGVDAWHRGLSLEPLLEQVELRPDWLPGPACMEPWALLGTRPRRGLHWLLVGAESGPGARPMDLAWVRSLRDQAGAAGSKFFYKQGPGPDGRLMEMPPLDGRVWMEVP